MGESYSHERVLPTLADTQAVAVKIAGMAQAGDVIALSGEVGAGKTSFAQAFISSLLERDERITSPTFTLVQHYRSAAGVPLLHADLYRLKHASELMEIGLEDAFESHISLIEWPEIAAAILPADTLYITLHHEAGDSRHLHWYSASQRWNGI
jgi:tRNA threonylcarbamoyl adenosine modification protein YjeE